MSNVPNILVEQLHQKVEDLSYYQNVIHDLIKRIDEMETEVNNLNQQVETLTEQVNSIRLTNFF
jgi:peptidoglycan hydrolase CwlO-like protein